MNPYFLLPLSPTINASSTVVSTNPAANVLNDTPGLTCRLDSASAGNIIFDFGAAVTLDTMALLGTNLRAADTVRLRAGTSAGNTTASPSWDSTALAAWSGIKTATRSKVVRTFPSHSARYWRIDIGATSHPDGYLELTRALFGVRYESPTPLPTRSAQFLMDPSVIEEAEGWETIDERDALPGWRVPFDWITDAQWRDAWWPFLLRAKLSKRVLFVPFPDEADWLQDSAVFGRIRSHENAHPIHDGWQCEITIMSNGL